MQFSQADLRIAIYVRLGDAIQTERTGKLLVILDIDNLSFLKAFKNLLILKEKT